MNRSVLPLSAAALVASTALVHAQTINTVWAAITGPTLRVDVSRNNLFVAAQITGGARIFSASTGAIVSGVTAPGTINDVSVSSDGSLVAVSTSGTGNNVCRVFETNTGQLVATLGAAGTGGIFVGRFSPNLTGVERLAIGNATTNRRVRVYSDDGAGTWNWTSFTDFGDALDLQPAGIGWNSTGTRFVAAFNTTLTPRSAIFDVASPGGPVVTHDAPVPNLVMGTASSAAFAPNGSTAVITGSSGFALYSGTSPAQIGSTTTGLTTVRDARYLNDSSGFLLRTGADVRSYDNTGSQTMTYSATTLPQYISQVTSNDRFYATATGGFIYAFTVGSASPVTLFTGSPNVFGSGCRSLTISPDGLLMVSAPHTGSNQPRLFNTATGAIATTITLPNADDRGHDFAFSPDGNILYIYTRPWQGAIVSRVTRWNPVTGTSAGSDFNSATSGNEGGQLNGGIALSPDGARLAFLNGNNRIMTIFNTSDGSTFATSAAFPGTSVANVRYTPDGANLIFCTRGSGNEAIHRMPVTAGTLTIAETGTMPTGSPAWVAVAPNGQFAVVRTGTQLVRFQLPAVSAGHTVLGSDFLASSSTASVDISPDSTRVVSGSSINGLEVRNAATGAPIAQAAGVFGIPYPIRFNPAGTHLGVVNTVGEVFYVSVAGAPAIGGTVFWEGPNSGPLPRLMVGWRTSGGSVVLPTVVIDVAPTNWQVRTVGPLVAGNTDSLIWQNTDPAFSIPGLIAYWNLATSGTPSPGGTGGAPPSFAWQVRDFRDLDSNGVSDVLWVNTATGLAAIWYRDAAGNVTGTVSVGVVPSGWNLVTAGTANRIFFQNVSTTQVVYWTLDNSGTITGSTSVGIPGAGWVLQGFGQFNIGPALLFRNTGSGLLAFWEIDPSGVVTATGTLGEAPAGWSILGVGRL